MDERSSKMEDSLKRKNPYLTDTKEKLKRVRIHSAPNLFDKKAGLNPQNDIISGDEQPTHHTNDERKQRGVRHKKVRSEQQLMEIEYSTCEVSANKAVYASKAEASSNLKLKSSYPSIFNLAHLNEKMMQCEEHIAQLTQKVHRLSIHDESMVNAVQSSGGLRKNTSRVYKEVKKGSTCNKITNKKPIQEITKCEQINLKKLELLAID